jgi:hypothetical protein
MKDWLRRRAKRIVAEATLREALKAIESTASTGGAATAGGSAQWILARHLAQHAADQLRLAEGGQ